MLVFSDLHLKEANEAIVWKALDRVEALALADRDRWVVFCGDWWQLRYQVSVRLLNKVHERMARWVDLGLQVDLVPGNHDQVTVDGVNALEVLARDGVEVWTEPGVQGEVGFVPFRKDPEEQLEALVAVREALTEAGAVYPIIFGHFGVTGAMMNTGRVDRDGLEIPDMGVVLLVLGHYHRYHEVKRTPEGTRVVYVGSTFQHTFGEAGNYTGAIRLTRGAPDPIQHIALDVGPQHYILTWDVGKDETPPPMPDGYKEGDKVRLDVKAPPSLISPDLIKSIKAAGLDDVQVNVEPEAETRDHRFDLVAGESLFEAARRFVSERVSYPLGDREPLIVKLMEWAGQ